MARHVHQRTVFGFAKTSRTERDTLIESHIATNDAGFANDNSRAVVDGKGFANLCSRVNVDACLSVRQFADDARQNGNFGAEQGIRHTIVQNGFHRRVAQNDFRKTRRSGVAFKDGFDIEPDETAQLGDTFHKSRGDLARTTVFSCH